VSEAAHTEARPKAVVEPPETIGDVVRGYWERLKAGEVGVLPVALGLVVIALFFNSKNSNYISAVNFNNVVIQMAGVAIIAMGVVFVLLIGEIDLSIGYVAGIGGVTVALLQQPDTTHMLGPFTIHQVGGLLAIIIAVAVGAAIGAFQGSFVALIGVPSFVVTLAGLLAWQGVVQRAIGDQGVITIQSTIVNDTANYLLPERWGWGLAIVAAALYALSVVLGVIGRRRTGLPSRNPVVLVLRVVVVAALCLFVAKVCNDAGGVPLPGVLVAALLIFWTFIAERTIFGRHVYAVGGNAEAARRSGISVPRIRIVVFMISSAMAAFGGVIFAARLTSVDLNAGGGTILLDAISAAVIGGTSLFGGRGHVRDAVVGALLIAAIANGIDLVGYSSSTRYIVTGVILLAAVTLDTVLRRRQATVGR
jgi:D-xylose transport system permease protein